MDTTASRRSVMELAAKLATDEVLELAETGAEAAPSALAASLDDRLSALALQSYMGRPAFVGRNASGGATVQFNVDSGSGYSSSWPAWAFEIANTALVTGKRMWVIADGSPFGSNLVSVMVLAT
jgi:hypothetical protein